MIERFMALPLPAKVAVVLAAAALAAAVLLLAYDWLGTRLLDSGGAVG